MHPHRPTRSLRAMLAILLLGRARRGLLGSRRRRDGGSPWVADRRVRRQPRAEHVGTGKAPFIPQIVSSEQVVGANRFAVRDRRRQAGQTRSARPTSPSRSAVPELGNARATRSRPCRPRSSGPSRRRARRLRRHGRPSRPPGTGSRSFTRQRAGLRRPRRSSVQFEVQPTGVVPSRSAPRRRRSRTPDRRDAGGDIAKIATDPDPDPAFYTTSVDGPGARQARAVRARLRHARSSA